VVSLNKLPDSAEEIKQNRGAFVFLELKLGLKKHGFVKEIKSRIIGF